MNGYTYKNNGNNLYSCNQSNMKKLVLLPALIILLALSARSQNSNSLTSLPDSIFSGKQGKMHVQGIAVDKRNGYIYFSFTDRLIKTDLFGKLIGSVTGFAGHLGDLDFNAANGKIYGSLEYKNDAIGKGIRNALGVQNNNQDGFYIAIFDVSNIVKPGMDAEKEGLLRTVYIREAVKDYKDSVQTDNKVKPHRFACSGIDGIAFAPAPGSYNTDKKYLYVAYGVYGDTDRTDNDQQVLLMYDIAGWDRYAQKLSQNELHHSGPEKPLEKYFLRTGNTRYGIQNLAYDPHTGNLFAAVYPGGKPQFPNYDLFVIDLHKKPVGDKIESDNKKVEVKTLSLLQAGSEDAKTGIRGWHFKWGATGLCPLGDGLFYISHNEKDRAGLEQSTIHKYQWIGNGQTSFVVAK
jgi:hypothetical protein